MQSSNTAEEPPVEGPLYVRWGPDRAAYALELRFDLVGELVEKLDRYASSGIEIGGVLLGKVVAGPTPTLRIDDVEQIPRRAEDGATYVLDPSQHQRLSEIRKRLRTAEHSVIGFFRTHLRPGQLRPSIADRTLLSGEFGDSVYVFLLIEGRDPQMAAFFVASKGELPAEPSVKEFVFDEAEFRQLPEVKPEVPSPSRFLEEPNRRSWWAIAALLLIGICACGLIWYYATGQIPPALRQSTDELQLALSNDGGLLQLRWDTTARALNNATGATLVIVNGSVNQSVDLGMDELRLGSVEYDGAVGPVQVTLTLIGSSSPNVSQTVRWPAK